MATVRTAAKDAVWGVPGIEAGIPSVPCAALLRQHVKAEECF